MALVGSASAPDKPERHIVYQAQNGVYLGRSTPRTLHLLPDGSTFSARAAQKIRRGERGWRYAVEQLVAAGSSTPTGDLAAWLKTAIAELATVRHPGNHRYAWAFGRSEKRTLAARTTPYPRALR